MQVIEVRVRWDFGKAHAQARVDVGGHYLDVEFGGAEVESVGRSLMGLTQEAVRRDAQRIMEDLAVEDVQLVGSPDV